MVALIDDLARRRLVYARPQATLPDIMLIDVPVRFAHPSLLLGRYYPILIETEAELVELEAWLAVPRESPLRPDLLDRRRSALVARTITFATYASPLPDWPLLLLCHWPTPYTALASDPDLFARGAYTSEAFGSAEALADACARLLASLGGEQGVSVNLIPPSTEPLGRA